MDEYNNDNWWEFVPCHFIWKLEKDVHYDYKAVVSNLDSKLETRNEIQWTDSACDMLLFRGYLEVSSFVGVKRNLQKAEEFYLEAEKEATDVSDDLERKACITVATANRLWIIKTTEQNQAASDKRKKLLEVLEQNWKNCHDDTSRERLQAHVDTIAAFALSRLGPSKCKEAERRYQRAIKIVGQSAKSSWYQSLGMMIGRQSRHKSGAPGNYEKINDEVRCYEKALEIDPTNDSARCDLSLVLARIPDRVTEAKEIIEQSEDKYCEIFIKKARFYRRLKDYPKCLEVLEKGERLQHPRAELFYQFSLVYRDLATKAKRNNKKKNLKQESDYLDKCLDTDPTHIVALHSKAFSCSKLGMRQEANVLYLRVIEEFKSRPFDLINAQYRYAVHITHGNDKTMNEFSAEAYEEVIKTAICILINVDMLEDSAVTNVFLPKSKECLVEYYRQSGKETRLQDLYNRLSEIGY